MNTSTRELLETQAILGLRAMESYRRKIVRIKRELESVRMDVKREAERVDGYLDTIAAADPSFNKEAWLNRAKAEWVL